MEPWTWIYDEQEQMPSKHACAAWPGVSKFRFEHLKIWLEIRAKYENQNELKVIKLEWSGTENSFRFKSRIVEDDNQDCTWESRDPEVCDQQMIITE